MVASAQNRLFVMAFGLAVATAACGSSGSGSSPPGSAAGSATGTVGGASLDVQDAFLANGVTTGTVVGVVSFADACATLYTSKRVPKGSSALSFQLVSYASGSAGPVTAPGTFTLIGGHPGADAFGAEWSFVDASCADTTVSATGGTVTVTAASGSQLTGTFDLTFGSDHLTGKFRALDCAAANSQGNPTCS
jgi:hypothetical protein